MDQPHQPGQTFEPDTKGAQPQQPDHQATAPVPAPKSETSVENSPRLGSEPTMQTPTKPIQNSSPNGQIETQPAKNLNPPEPSPTPPTTQNQFNQHRVPIAKPKHRRFKAISIVFGAILLLTSGIAYAYFGVMVPNQPENVLKAMLANSLSTETVQSTGQFEITTDEGKFLVDLESASDISDFQNPKAKIKLSADLQVTNLVADMRLLDNELFFNLSGLDGVEQLAQSQFSFNPEMAEVVSGIFDAVLGQWFIVNKSLVTEAVDFSQITQSEIDSIKEAADGVEFFEVVTVHDDERVRDVDAHHYTVRPSNEGIKNFLDRLVGKSFAGEEVLQEEIDKIKEQIDEDPFQDDSTLDMWVYKDTKQLAKTHIELIDSTDDFTSNTTMEFFGYNEPVTIEKPENPKSIMELLALVQSAVTQILGDNFMDSGNFQDSLEFETEFTPATLGEILQR